MHPQVGFQNYLSDNKKERPALNVKYVEEGENGFDIGQIYNPFVCCDYELHVVSANGEPRYFINSDWCACNMYCCFNCESCNKSSLSIFDKNYQPMSKIEMVTLFKRFGLVIF